MLNFKTLTFLMTCTSILFFNGCSPSRGTMEKWVKTNQESKLIDYLNKSSKESKNNIYNTEAIKLSIVVATTTRSKITIEAAEKLACSDLVNLSVRELILETLCSSNSSPQMSTELLTIYYNPASLIANNPSLKQYVTRIASDGIAVFTVENYNKYLDQHNYTDCINVLQKYIKLNTQQKFNAVEALKCITDYNKNCIEKQQYEHQLESNSAANEINLTRLRVMEKDYKKETNACKGVQRLAWIITSKGSLNDSVDTYQGSYSPASSGIEGLMRNSKPGVLCYSETAKEERESRRAGHGRAVVYAEVNELLSSYSSSFGVLTWDVVPDARIERLKNFPSQITELKAQIKFIEKESDEIKAKLLVVEGLIKNNVQNSICI